MSERMTIAITGHRPDSLDGDYEMKSPLWHWIGEQLHETFLKIKPKFMWDGMALGVDTLAVEIALAENIPFGAAIPFPGQEKSWPKEHQEHYRMLLEFAQEQVIVSEKYVGAWVFQKRNEFMVDRADLLVAVWNGKAGGTRNCVNYALRDRVNVPVLRINPDTREVGRWDGKTLHKPSVSV